VSGGRPPVCDYEGSNYQERFWEAGERAYEDAVEGVALKRLLPPGQGRLLEVGAGAGRNTPRYRGYHQIVLLDYSRTQLEQAQARLGGGDQWRFVVGDAYCLPFAPGVFEAATMIRTLHHMTDPLAALKQVRGCLAAEAVFILEYANKHNLKAMLRWAARRQEWNPFDRRPVEFAPLNFDFHPAAVRAWLRAAGFRTERQLAVSHFRMPLFKRRLPLPWDGSTAWCSGQAPYGSFHRAFLCAPGLKVTAHLMPTPSGVARAAGAWQWTSSRMVSIAPIAAGCGGSGPASTISNSRLKDPISDRIGSRRTAAGNSRARRERSRHFRWAGERRAGRPAAQADGRMSYNDRRPAWPESMRPGGSA
jgi:SAM-dependent methyltransferase